MALKDSWRERKLLPPKVDTKSSNKLPKSIQNLDTGCHWHHWHHWHICPCSNHPTIQPSNHPTIQPSNLRTGGFQALSHLGHRHHTTCHGDIAARPLVSACRARWLYNSQWWPTTTGETGGVSLEHFRLNQRSKGSNRIKDLWIPLSSLSISFQSERGGISAF